MKEFTPIEKVNNILVKRDDLFEVNGVCGGKVRSCYKLMEKAVSNGFRGVVTAGSRMSPQINIVSHLAEYFELDSIAHSPEGKLSPELLMALTKGIKIKQNQAGYNSVIISRAKLDAKNLNYFEIPFGMECNEATNETKQQVASIVKYKNDINRIIIPVGSAMTLSGLLMGLRENGLSIPVLGIMVGANPTDRLNRYAPMYWNRYAELIQSSYDYHTEVKDYIYGGIELDPIYEAKVIPYIKKSDLLWIVGKRASLGKIFDRKEIMIKHSKQIMRVTKKDYEVDNTNRLF
jgi:1-aminocyclopropane-1-carboxylate deaminase/D-cysteine desulfhydrase-like pyridoxal-dependent ACC family enzyme